MMDGNDKRCRLCLSEEVTDESIFSNVDEEGVPLYTKIVLCTSLVVTESDAFPKFICAPCTNLVGLFFDFRNTCFKSHISMFNLTQAMPDSFLLQVDDGKDEMDLKLTELEVACQSKIFSEDDLPIDSDLDLVSQKKTLFDQEIGGEEEIENAENQGEQPGEVTEQGNGVDAPSYVFIGCKSGYGTIEGLNRQWDPCQNGERQRVCQVEELEGEGGEAWAVVKEKRVEEGNCVKTKEFSCTHCQKVFKQHILLERHVKTNHVGVRPFTCPHCPRTFFDKYELKYHQRLHADVENFCCNVCGRRFARQSGLKSHMRSHTGEKPYVCKQCGKGFAYLNSLTAHERVHTGEKPYSCRFCKRTFSQYSTARGHEGMHLGGERMFQCEVCDRMYATDEELQTHFLSHQVDNHKCNECGRGFKKSAELTKHVQRNHSQVKPYPCSSCSKSFVTLNELTSHITVHTGELPFKCVSCGKGYRLKSTLRKHMYKHHAQLLNPP